MLAQAAKPQNYYVVVGSNRVLTTNVVEEYPIPEGVTELQLSTAITAVSGTTPQLTITLETIDPFYYISVAQTQSDPITAATTWDLIISSTPYYNHTLTAGNVRNRPGVITRTVRVSFTVTGTTPSFTITSVLTAKCS